MVAGDDRCPVNTYMVYGVYGTIRVTPNGGWVGDVATWPGVFEVFANLAAAPCLMEVGRWARMYSHRFIEACFQRFDAEI